MIENGTLGKNKTLSPRQRKAIEALLTRGSISAAAEAAGVARVTMYRWMREPAFMAELSKAEDAAMASLQRTLVALASLATVTLAKGMEGKATSSQIRAADISLSKLLLLRDLVAFERRLAALEAVHGESAAEN